MNFIKDIYRFINYLSFVDIVFFVAIITLLILLVVLVYFIKINKDVIENPKISDNNEMDNKIDINKVESKPNNLKEIVESLDVSPSIDLHDDDEDVELLDLEGLTKKLKEQRENNCINFTEYEKDQEEKAIISYDELLEKKNNYTINYEKEIKDDDVIIKKVNLNDLVNKNEVDEYAKIEKVRVISYEKEEAFLSALKELNRLLN